MVGGGGQGLDGGRTRGRGGRGGRAASGGGGLPFFALAHSKNRKMDNKNNACMHTS